MCARSREIFADTTIQLWLSGTSKPKHLASAKPCFQWLAKHGVESGVLKNLDAVHLMTEVRQSSTRGLTPPQWLVAHLYLPSRTQLELKDETTQAAVLSQAGSKHISNATRATLSEDPGIYLKEALVEANRFCHETGFPWSGLICVQKTEDLERVTDWINNYLMRDLMTGTRWQADCAPPLAQLVPIPSHESP